MDPSTMTGDEIVITGISGKFPNSENVRIFQENILNMVDCITNDDPRWKLGYPKIPERIGQMKDVNKFDPILFGINQKLADVMDPISRLSMECAYEAIADSGNNPRKMKGARCAVFTGNCFSETEKTIWEGTGRSMSNFTLLGAAKAMFANRISFFLGINGPSFTIDNNCIGSATALEEAYKLIKSGKVDSAIVCGGNLALHPEVSLQFFYLGLLSPDGITRSFDDAANGYARSEAIVVFYLQRARDAKRIYAEIKGVRSMIGSSYDRNSVLHPTCDFQMEVMKLTLKDSGISGKEVSFVEADGMGIKETDAEEVKAIDKVYNEGRKTPLLIGSVKSNVGSCAAANTVVAIVKVLTMMNYGYIPPNLNYKNPSEKIPVLKDGRIKVVTKPTPWQGDYVAINNTSIGGGCASVILKSYKKEKKNGGQPDDDMPRLITVSGSSKEAVAAILDDVESRPVDTEMLQLLNNIFEVENPSHIYRGYSLLPSHGLVKSKHRDIQYSPGGKRDVWYLFSGMGSQWAGMGEAFMKLPVFAEAVQKCDTVLKPHGIDIIRILTEKDPKIVDDIINSFVAIATCQIGLVDLLNYFGIKPDYMIGHSVGELGCAYADGCFTAEQMVLSALSRGMASVESNLPRGSMAAVGIGYEYLEPICPPDIDIACHNSLESSTISGPAETMKKFVAHLTAKGIFAKEVACGNIAFHSRYIAPAGVKLKEYLQKVIPNPRPRSFRWISTSVPHGEWNSVKARLSSAEYHTNNLLGSVLFAESARAIPANAIVIEIAPHGLLQAIVRKSLPEGVINVPLTKRGHPDNVEYMMAALGKIYNGGLNINVSKLYPKVNYPVSRGTPSISPLIKWDHSKDWGTVFYVKHIAFKEGEKIFKIDLNSDSWKFLKGNKIDNKIILPYSLYLKLAWSVMESFSEEMEQPIIFDNVVIHKIQNVTEDEVLELTVMVQRGSGSFEITSHGTLLCSGALQKNYFIVQKKTQNSNEFKKSQEELNQSDIYNELQMRGLQYSGCFRSIHKVNANGSYGVLVAQKEWIAFIEGMFQMYIFGNNLKTTQVPLKVTKIIVDMKQYKEKSQNTKLIPVLVDQQLKIVCSGGVEMQGISLMPIKRDFSKCLVDIEEIKTVSAADESVKTQSISIFQKDRKVENWIACQIDTGNLNSIDWVEGQAFHKSDSNEVVKVEYSTIDESDFLLATGKMTSDVAHRTKDLPQVKSRLKNFGLEYSGIDTKGMNVMGISDRGTLSCFTIPDPELIWHVPKTWSLQDAATVPLAYATSYMALYLKGDIKKKESVLIYDGVSSLGQASINLALNEECEVFTTYANNDEKAFLEKRYPTINEDHLFWSKSAFENKILLATKGAGVDLLIYNSSSLNKIESHLLCAKTHARVIVLGNLLNAFRKSVGMRLFLKEIALYSIIPNKMVDADVDTKQKLADMIKTGISKGIVKPLSSNLYAREELRNAFTDGGKRSSGKVVIKVQPENSSKVALVSSRFSFSNQRSYLIIDDLSTFGLELVNFLVARGAKDIFIASARKNIKTLFNYRKRIWQESGARVIFCEDLDYSVQDNVRKLLSEASKLNPIDVIFDLQRMEESSARTSSSKYLFTKNLAEESTNKCTKLRQFVVCSTSKYPDENLNNILLRDINVVKLCEERSRDGLPAILILWGPIEEIVESNISKEKKMHLLTIPQCVEQLEDLIGLSTPVIKASYSKSAILMSPENATENKAIREKNERAKFYDYLYTTEVAVANKLINLIREEKII